MAHNSERMDRETIDAGIHAFHQQWPLASASPGINDHPACRRTATAAEVLTIFSRGLPIAINEWELHNLLLVPDLLGFEASSPPCTRTSPPRQDSTCLCNG
uniref:Uncharacterized protein n=1 Tax=Setaria italica TaxID=4555 RepID=K4AH34_SETIT